MSNQEFVLEQDVFFKKLVVRGEFSLEVVGQLFDSGAIMYIEGTAYAVTLITHDDE